MILVTGATGTTGGEVARQLAAKGAPLRALVRNPAKADGLKQLGVEIAVGDMTDPASLDPALAGIERVYLVTPPEADLVALHANVVDAAVRAGARHVVKISSFFTSATTPVVYARQHWQAEETIRGSGIGYTFLHPSFFMQNFLFFAPAIKKDGVFAVPMSEGRVSMIDARDIAAVAAAALTEDAHLGKTYVITGPQALTFGDAAGLLGEAIGKPVSHDNITPEAERAALIAAGDTAEHADDLLAVYEAFDKGAGLAVEPTVRDIGKTEPHTFADFARDYAHRFKD